uniref:Uncharacterized protein n=1 Tax=viral metagenome TaxID=1070528 RepID=A0A6C0ENI9_9ZZZZ
MAVEKNTKEKKAHKTTNAVILYIFRSVMIYVNYQFILIVKFKF